MIRTAVLGGAAALAATAVAVATAAAATVPGTFGWDYRNRPVAAPLLGYETVALSPRALDTAAADSLAAAGATILLWLQPVWSAWHGRPVRDHAWDAGLVALVERFDASLRDSTGTPCTLFGPGHDAATVLDFRVAGFPEALAGQLAAFARRGPGAGGVLLDYGCGTVAWTVEGVPPAEWARWGGGFARFLAALRAEWPDGRIVVQCDRWTPWTRGRADGILLERAGWSLNPPAKVWATLNEDTAARASVVRVEDATPARRRLFAAMALVAGASFHWSDLAGATGGVPAHPNLRDPEHFELAPGAPLGPWHEVRPGLVERRFAHGFAAFNLGPRARRWTAPDGRVRTLAPSDGLVVVRGAAGNGAVNAAGAASNEGR